MIAQEQHQDQTHHLHIAIWLMEQLRTRDRHFFDFICAKHGNYQYMRSGYGAYNYLHKEVQETIYNYIILISTLVSKLSYYIFYTNCNWCSCAGSDSTFIWRGPDSVKETTGSEQREAFWQITAAQEIDSDCESFTIWVLPKRDNAGRPWLLYAKLEPNQDFPILLLEPMQQSVTTTLEPTTGTLRNGHPYAKGSRLVELQYQLRETIQSEAALALWASKFLQNDASRTVTKLLHHIRDSQGRRLLRLLRKSGTPTMSLGRISRAENNLLVKRVPPGIGDEPQAKR